MRVDFYQLSQSPVEAALPLIARATLASGERLLVVSAEPAQQTRISDGLWALKDSFLAHGLAGGPHEVRQPILLSDVCEAANGARFVALADGQWRDAAEAFDRVFLFFDAATLGGARTTWRQLGDRDDAERHFWKQDCGKWVEGP